MNWVEETKDTVAAIAAAKFSDKDAKVVSRAIFDCLAGWYHNQNWYENPSVPLDVLEMVVHQVLVEWPKNPTGQ